MKDVHAGLFKCQERSRKQFSLLWKHCKARATLFSRFDRRGCAVNHVQAYLSAKKDLEAVLTTVEAL